MAARGANAGKVPVIPSRPAPAKPTPAPAPVVSFKPSPYTADKLCTMNVETLKEVCRTLGRTGYSAMGKAQLVGLAFTNQKMDKDTAERKYPAAKSTGGVRGSTGPTVKDLQAKLKAKGLTGYSGLSKELLEKYLQTGVKPAPKAGSVGALREQCRTAKASGKLQGSYSKLTKAEMEKALASGKCVAKAPNAGTADPAYSKMKAAELKAAYEAVKAGRTVAKAA